MFYFTWNITRAEVIVVLRQGRNKTTVCHESPDKKMKMKDPITTLRFRPSVPEWY